MSDKPLHRPSDDPGELGSQLLRELDGIDREGGSWKTPALFRAYLQHAQALAWQGVAAGDLDAPRRILDHLIAAQTFVDRHRAQAPEPAAQAAEEVHQVIRSLYLANDVLGEARTTARFADRERSRTEREILRVLFENRGTFLRRGAVRARMDPAGRPTPARVGQILVDLHEEKLVLRTHGRAQGSASAAFYALSPLGFELCRSLGFADAARVRRLVAKVVAPDTLPRERKMLVDALSTCSDSKFVDLVIEALEEGLGQESDEATADRFKEILVAVLLARRQIDFGARAVAGSEDTAHGRDRGLYIFKSKESESGLLSSDIVDAYIKKLESEVAKNGLIDALLKERDRLAQALNRDFRKDPRGAREAVAAHG